MIIPIIPQPTIPPLTGLAPEDQKICKGGSINTHAQNQYEIMCEVGYHVHTPEGVTFWQARVGVGKCYYRANHVLLSTTQSLRHPLVIHQPVLLFPAYNPGLSIQ